MVSGLFSERLYFRRSGIADIVAANHKREKKMKKLCVVGVLAATAFTSGCASIVSGHNQPLSVESRMKGAQVTGANCKLSNDKGTWYVTTPGSTVVNRSFNDLTIRCEKDGITPGALAVKSTTKGMAFGNILFGGVIGAGVDMASGAAYDYPSLITIEMGELPFVAPPAVDAPRAEAAPADTKSAN
ncbi:MAG: hypothetical protein AB1710_04485 [Pseudomonadota bacterium]